MRLEGEQVLLRVHVSNHVRWHGRPLYEVLVERARHQQLAGATVLAALAGYVGTELSPESHGFTLGSAHPMVIEIVDAAEAVERFLASAGDLLATQPVLITTERAHVVHYRSRS